MKRKRSVFARGGQNTMPVSAAAGGERTLYLYDEISWWGLSAEWFKDQLVDLGPSDTVHVRINSPGGDVFEGTAIYNLLRQSPAKVVVHVDGLAASIASVIALGGDEIRIADAAWFMVHEPYTITIGNAAELRKEANLLDKISGTMADLYAKRTGNDLETVKAWMEEETWFTGAEAVEHGLADLVIEGPEEALKIAAAFDLTVFAHTPDRLLGRLDGGDVKETNPRDLERVLREAGLSRAAAKAFVAGGREAVSQRDAAEPKQRDAVVVPQGRAISVADIVLADVEEASE